MRTDDKEPHATSSVVAVEDSKQEAPALVSIGEAEDALGISRTTRYEMVREGRFPLPVLRVGDRYRVSRKALEDFIARTE